MHWNARLVTLVFTAAFPFLAIAKSDAYQAGREAGEKFGRLLVQFLPYAAIAIVVVILVVWLGWRFFVRRRAGNGAQA